MTTIHPTAVVDRRAELGEHVSVGPLCYIGPNVVIGANTRLISHVCILGPTKIGEHNAIWPNTVLGGDPQDVKHKGESTELVIGDHNEFRESVTVHRGTMTDQGTTRVGSHNLIMAYGHVAHDCVIADHVVLSNGVGLAGHIHIGSYANIGGLVGCHHFLTIGQYCFVGGMARLVSDVPPFMIVEGNPAKVRGVNTIGLIRHGFDEQTIERLKDAYKRLFKNAAQDKGVGQLAENLDGLERDYADDKTVAMLIDAVRNASNGIHGRYRESLRQDDPRKTIPM